MTRRQLLRLFVALLVMSFASPGLAANKDAATLKKIDQALNVHYLAAEYDKAESVVLAAIKACGTNSCSGEVLAKAYVAVGVIRGNAKQDLAGARTAFENAKAADPNASLDASLVTRKVLLVFYEVMEREPPPDASGSAADKSSKEPKPRVSPAGNLQCTPASGYEIQTAQPIAVVCEPLEGVVRAELYYRMAGETEYAAVLMTVEDGTLRATLPCEPLVKPGKLQLYISAQDFNKEQIDTFGTKINPAHYVIVKDTKQPVPTYPGQPAPKRCEELLKGGAKEGEACNEIQPCQSSLYCSEGACRRAPSCESNTDCGSNRCNDGYCDMSTEAFDESVKPNRFMFGLHFGPDIWFAPSTKQVCGDQSLVNGEYSCYNAGYRQLFRSTPGKLSDLPIASEGYGGNVDAGVRLATFRVLLSGDYVLTRHLSLGGRVGWAFAGGPRAIHYTNGIASQGKRFFPVHVEARGTLWLRSLSKPGLHPYLALGGGIAEVDAKIPITAKKNGATRELDAWRKMGLGFGTVAVGGLLTFGKHFGAQLNLNVMYLFTSTGLVLEPTAGIVYGF